MTGAADRRSRRREELLDAAGRVIAAHGPEVSMTAIAAEAGITKPILYRHFGDKRGLYRALAERSAEPLAQTLRAIVTGPGGRRERVHRAIAAYLGVAGSAPEVFRLLLQPAPVDASEGPAATSAAIRHIGEELGAALAAEAGLDAGTAAAWGHGIAGMVQVAGDWWLEHPEMPPDALAEQLTALLWGAMAALPDRRPNQEGEGDAAELD